MVLEGWSPSDIGKIRWNAPTTQAKRAKLRSIDGLCVCRATLSPATRRAEVITAGPTYIAMQKQPFPKQLSPGLCPSIRLYYQGFMRAREFTGNAATQHDSCVSMLA
jgi:hypothetical protein